MAVNYLEFKQAIMKAVNDFTNSFKPSNPPEIVQESVGLINNLLNVPTSGGDLWDLIENEVKRLPEWWSFFRRVLIPLREALEHVLKNYPQKKLIQADMESLRLENSKLKLGQQSLETQLFTLQGNFEKSKDASLVEEYRKAQAELVELKKQNSKKDEKIVALEKTNADQEGTIENLKKQIKILEEANARLKEANDKLEKIEKHLTEKNSKSEKKHDDFKVEVRAEFEKFKKRQDDMQGEINSLKENNQQLLTDNRLQKQQLQEKNTQILQLTDVKNKQGQLIAGLEQGKQQLEIDNKELELNNRTQKTMIGNLVASQSAYGNNNKYAGYGRHFRAGNSNNEKASQEAGQEATAGYSNYTPSILGCEIHGSNLLPRGTIY